MKRKIKMLTHAGILGATIPVAAQTADINSIAILINNDGQRLTAEVITDQPDNFVVEAIDQAISKYTSLFQNYAYPDISGVLKDDIVSDVFTQRALELKSLKDAYERMMSEEGSHIDFSIIGDMPSDVEIYMSTGLPNKDDL